MDFKKLDLAVKKFDSVKNEARAIAWQQLKEKAPDLANMIDLHVKSFGKPKHIKIELGGNVIFDNSTRR